MFLQKPPKERIQFEDKQIENMKRETQILFNELGITQEELEEFLSKRENFSKKEWNTIQEER